MVAPQLNDAGTTHTLPTAVYCGGCGAVFGARVQGGIDAAKDAALVRKLVEAGIAALNQATCPECGWRTSPAEPVLVHRPGEALFLVLPAAQRHRIRQALGEALARVMPAVGEVLPAYAQVPVVLAEDDLRLGSALLAESPRSAGARAERPVEPRRPLERPTLLDDPLASRDISLDDLAVPETPRAEVTRADVVLAELRAEGVLGPARSESRADVTRADVAVIPDLDLEPDLPQVSRDEAISLNSIHLDGPDDPLASRDVSLESMERSEAPTPAVSRPMPIEGRPSLGTPPQDSESAPPFRVAPAPSRVEGGSEPPEASTDLLAELLRPPPSTPRPGPSAPTPAGDWTRLDQGWSLEAAVPRPEGDPTHVVHLDDIEPRGARFEAARATLQPDAYVQVGERGVELVAHMAADRARRFLDDMVELRFQLHSTPLGPVAGLLLVRLDAQNNAEDHFLWVIDEQTPGGEETLERLEAAFSVHVRLHSEDRVGERHLTAPLEANVGTSLLVLLDAQGDRAAARRAVLAPEFDRLGRLRHGFHQESFAELSSAADARLALGILGYWSTPERRDYLLRVKSFPEPWFDAMTRRVLTAAIEFGLSMEPHLRQRTLELKLAPNSAALLRRSLANFAEVNLNLKAGGLDVLDTWENWEALLAHAEELDLRVDEEIEELAARAMERARHAAQEPTEGHLADESIELEEAELSELGEEELVGLLGRPQSRLEATLALLQRSDASFVPALFDAIKAMGREELLHAVPAALALGPAFEAHFLGALRARRPSLRLASALFLSEIRSERAVGPLLALLSSASETEWGVLSRAAARMGRRILAPALAQVQHEGDAHNRIAHTLALLGGEGRGALAAARDQRADARIRACLNTALERMHEVSFGDPADFTERLADAFAAAGPDRVGPDFEEVLESIDLGPGASLGDLETDVNLDDPES